MFINYTSCKLTCLNPALGSPVFVAHLVARGNYVTNFQYADLSKIFLLRVVIKQHSKNDKIYIEKVYI